MLPMYTQFFRLTQAPFSISPDPRYLFMSDRHREALAHLLYGIDSGGGIVLLTGDIGTGKTTVCRCFLEQVPANCNVAYIFNPKLTVSELLQAICDEFHIEIGHDPRGASVKEYIDKLNRHLLETHANGRNNVLVIDEAQNLSADVLEQLRLLTNLETNERKLLQIILIGQPELREILARPDLEQLAQRIIAHYHLTALSEQETASYIHHRLAMAGLTSASPFQAPLMKEIHKLTRGIPRRINLLCDRAMLGAYAKGVRTIDRGLLARAANELFVSHGRAKSSMRRRMQYAALGLLSGAMLAGAAVWTTQNEDRLKQLQAWAAESMATLTKADPTKIDNSSQGINATNPTTAGTMEAVPPADEAPPSAQQANDSISMIGLWSEQEAISDLAKLWGVKLQDKNPCQGVEKYGLRCYKTDNGLAELRRLDRPAVIKLHDDPDKTYYAMLTRLTDTHATLQVGAASHELDLPVLLRHFTGESITLWRAPPDFDKTIGTGAQGSAVDWIGTQLAKLNGEPPPNAGQPYDRILENQVRRFQQAQGLLVDGVVGPVTVMHLNRIAGLAEPRLVHRPASGE